MTALHQMAWLSLARSALAIGRSDKDLAAEPQPSQHHTARVPTSSTRVSSSLRSTRLASNLGPFAILNIAALTGLADGFGREIALPSVKTDDEARSVAQLRLLGFTPDSWFPRSSRMRTQPDASPQSVPNTPCDERSLREDFQSVKDERPPAGVRDGIGTTDCGRRKTRA
jgi:hypothetical protein